MSDTPKNAGEIVRIETYNFMSYDNFKIYPRSNLNLIIGPNGTGKSSIVCAVLLCIGGKLKTLGRADHLSSYIKSGCNESKIEIELFNPDGPNDVITRKFFTNNHSEFFLNGKSVTGKKMEQLRCNYKIEPDNLCTFLPQERVQDFAKLNSQQLLDQTQRIVGNGELIQQFETMKIFQKETFDLEKRFEILQMELEKEKQKNDKIKDQVKFFKEKQKLIEKLGFLKQKLAWVIYLQENNRKNKISEKTKLAEKVYLEHNEYVDYCDNVLKEINNRIELLEQKINEAKKNEVGKKNLVQERIKKAKSGLNELKKFQNILQSKLEEENKKKSELLNYKENQEKLQNDLKNFDEEIGSEANLNLQMKEIETKFKKLHEEESRLSHEKFNLEEKGDSIKQDVRNITHESKILRECQNLRLEYLKKNEPDVYKSIDWLKENRNLFKSYIYNPMLLEIDITNPDMAKYVESRINYNDLISFLCTNPEDLNLLVQKLRKEKNYKINVICSDVNESSQYYAEIPITDLKQYGFFTYMQDFISGPDDIIRFLCKTYKIHRIPIGDERVKENCEKIPRSIPLFFSKDYVFTVKYSVYSGGKALNVKKLQPPRFFGQSTDTQRMKFLEDREKELEITLQENRLEVAEVDKEITRIRMELMEVKGKRRDIATHIQKREMIQMNLKRASGHCKSLQNSLRNPDEIVKEINDQEENIIKNLIKNIKNCKRANADYQNVKINRLTTELEYKIIRRARKKICSTKIILSDRRTHVENVFRKIKDRVKEAEHKCEQLKTRAKTLTNNISIEEKRFSEFKKTFSELPNTVNELESKIDAVQAKSEFLQGNVEILNEYEKREEKIFQLTSSLESNKKNIEDRKRELTRMREEWLHPINELVSKINKRFEKYFEAMGCAGEISLDHGENHEDLDKYGIKIKVKFRDGIPLEELGRYFQSGGERAVTTALYMLALQKIISVPFRFIDEINQGMDPINEKRIIEILMKVTSQKNSSQYFFITPKLLPNIKYSEKLTVHCINSGPYVEPSSKWSRPNLLYPAESSEAEDSS